MICVKFSPMPDSEAICSNATDFLERLRGQKLVFEGGFTEYEHVGVLGMYPSSKP